MNPMTPATSLNMPACQLVECPRDAMQGWHAFIPTDKKVEYINALLEVGFDTIDFGSFVSPKAIPQMADTKEVIPQLRLDRSPSRLLAIVANVRGAREAVAYDEVSYLGFPFSLSPTFQMRNANSTLEESIGRVEAIRELCALRNKQLVVYLSMGFGNPYGDAYQEDILLHWAGEMVECGVGIISLADTVGLARPEQVATALAALLPAYPDTTFGVHLHAAPDNWQPKLEAALYAGCRRFDGALKGIGGCPMAGNELVGNMNTEWMLKLLEKNGWTNRLNQDALQRSLELAARIFN